jgi:hypothetical protein
MTSSLQKLYRMTKEIGRNEFSQNGLMPPRFFLQIETHDGQSLSLETVCTWSSNQEKFSQIEALKSEIRRLGDLQSFCFISEVWGAPSIAGHPSLSPHRTELLLVLAQDKSGKVISSACPITRHPSSRATLGAWKTMDDSDLSGGLFSALFTKPAIQH